jgi:paraquat-inducible protein A
MKNSEHKLINCPYCQAVNNDAGDETICRRCNSTIHHFEHISFQKSLAYLITAMILFIPANFYPVLITEQFGMQEANTIIGGVIVLWEEGSYPIALIILFASIFVPIIKFILILYLLISTKLKRHTNKIDKLRLFHITELIGPWSMIDVFVVSILAALVQMTNVQIHPGIGITAFAMMVFFTLLSALAFDTRLIWSSAMITIKEKKDA